MIKSFDFSIINTQLWERCRKREGGVEQEREKEKGTDTHTDCDSHSQALNNRIAIYTP